MENNQVNSGTNKAQQGLDNAMSYAKENPMTIVLVATAILVIYLAFYAIYMLQRQDLNGEILIGNPVKASTYRMVSVDKIPKSLNGEESSMSFWIYINDLTTGSYKHIAHRSGDDYGPPGDVLKGSPFIYLDKNSNRMFIRFDTSANVAADKQYPEVEMTVATNSITVTSTTDKSEIDGKLASIVTSSGQVYDVNGNGYNVAGVDSNEDGTYSSFTATDAPDGPLYFTKSNKNSRTFHKYDRDDNEIGVNDTWSGITIDYIPLQKWTNITYVVKEQVIIVFVDGDIYKTITRGSNKLVQHDTANLYIGGTTAIPQSKSTGDSDLDQSKAPTTFDGYLSKFEYFNYALPLSSVTNIYSKGPMDKGLVDTLGLPNLGVQSPVYVKEDI